jgi:hypothetical protein
MSYYKIIGGQKYDRAILEAFQTSIAGQGDGRVSGGDVEKVLKSKVADGKGLTDIEAQTLRYAVDRFNVTGKGQRELDALLESITGQPFQWQVTDNPVQGRIDGQAMSHKQLAEAATKFVLGNTSAGASVDDGKLFPHPDASNMGLFAYTLDGSQASQMVQLAKATMGSSGAAVLDKFDPAKHEILTVRFTSDEEAMYVGLLDKATGKVEMAGEFAFVDLQYDFDDADDFAAKTGIKVTDIDPNVDPEYWSEVDQEEFAAFLTRGGTLLDLGKSDDVFGRPSDKRIEELGYPLSSDFRDENIMDGEVAVDFGQLPLGYDMGRAALRIADEVFRWDDVVWDDALKASAPRGLTDGAIKSAAQDIHDGFGYAPQNTDSFDTNHGRLEKLIGKLGKRGDIKVVDVSGKGTPDHLDTAVPFAGTLFVNEKTGDFVAVTTRQASIV